MTSIAKFTQHAGEVVEGQYYLTEIALCRGTTRKRWVLEDFSGKASVILSSTGQATGISMPEQTAIRAALVPKPLSQMMGGTLLAASPLLATEVWNAAAVCSHECCPFKSSGGIRRFNGIDR
jgi:hypothetical protein